MSPEEKQHKLESEMQEGQKLKEKKAKAEGAEMAMAKRWGLPWPKVNKGSEERRAFHQQLNGKMVCMSLSQKLPRGSWRSL
eukprot:5498634-Karenia_brevis.AAC.1